MTDQKQKATDEGIFNSLGLVHFRAAEFRRGGVQWFLVMDPRLLVLLDTFRFMWGRPVAISQHPAALGRHLSDSRSDHNVDRDGTVYAADVHPIGMDTRERAEQAIELARSIGFTAIGVYPHWQPRPGLHLGTRRDRRPGKPAEWGAVRRDDRQVFTSMDHALVSWSLQ